MMTIKNKRHVRLDDERQLSKVSGESLDTLTAEEMVWSPLEVGQDFVARTINAGRRRSAAIVTASSAIFVGGAKTGEAVYSAELRMLYVNSMAIPTENVPLGVHHMMVNNPDTGRPTELNIGRHSSGFAVCLRDQLPDGSWGPWSSTMTLVI